jgi:hypothetical protein
MLYTSISHSCATMRYASIEHISQSVHQKCYSSSRVQFPVETNDNQGFVIKNYTEIKVVALPQNRHEVATCYLDSQALSSES